MGIKPFNTISAKELEILGNTSPGQSHNVT